MTLEEIQTHASQGGRFIVQGMPKVAWRYIGEQVDRIFVWEDQDYEQQPTGMVRMVMVGDDQPHVHDPIDVIAINREDYCAECGQIGCGHDGLER